MYEETEEIDLVSLFFTVLHKYRQILAVAMICAVLGGVLGVYKYSRSRVDAEQTVEQEYEQAMTEYHDLQIQREAAVNSFKLQLKQNEAEQERSEYDIEHAQEYISKSVLNSLDPYKVSMSTAIYCISTGYKIQPGMTYQDPDYTGAVLSAYSSLLTDHSAVSEIAQQFNMEERYLSELINVQVDPETHLLTISIYAQTEDTSRAILDAVMERFGQLRSTIASTVAPHTVKQVSVSTSTTVQSWLRETQRTSDDNITALQTRMTELQNAHDVLEENLADAQQALSDLHQPQRPATGRSSAVKYAVLGFLLGGVAAAGIAVVRFLTAGKVYSAQELHRTTGLAVLGALAVPCTKKLRGLDKQINKWERRPDGSTDGEILDLIAATILNRAPEANRILVTGDVDDALLSALAQGLQTAAALQGRTVTAAPSILRSAATVSQAVQADAIILAADCRSTRYTSVRAQDEQIRDLGKKIFGCVVYE